MGISHRHYPRYRLVRGNEQRGHATCNCHTHRQNALEHGGIQETACVRSQCWIKADEYRTDERPLRWHSPQGGMTN